MSSWPEKYHRLVVPHAHAAHSPTGRTSGPQALPRLRHTGSLTIITMKRVLCMMVVGAISGTFASY